MTRVPTTYLAWARTTWSSIDDGTNQVASVTTFPNPGTVCLGTILLVALVAVVLGILGQWWKYRRGPEGGFDRGRTIVLAVIASIILIISGISIGLPWMEYLARRSNGDLEYYNLTNPASVETMHFNAGTFDDVDSIIFDGRLFIFYIDDDKNNLSLGYLEWVETEISIEPNHLATLGNSEYPRKVRGRTTAIIEDDDLVVYYSFIDRTGEYTDKRSWRMESKDGISWSTPIEVSSVPENKDNQEELPTTFDLFMDVEVYDYRISRLPDGGRIAAIRYFHDEGDYPDFKGVFFSYKPAGKEWSKLVNIGAVPTIPEGIHEFPNGTVVTVNPGSGGIHTSTVVVAHYFNGLDFKALDGPYHLG